jgi:hypothetical protein
MGLGVFIAQELAKVLYKKCWHLIESDSSRIFLTSDNPVVLLPAPHHRPPMKIGYHDGWIMLPLSPKRALLLTNKLLSKNIIPIMEDKMIEYQWYIIARCYQLVFSNIESQEFKRILDGIEEDQITQVDLG